MWWMIVMEKQPTSISTPNHLLLFQKTLQVEINPGMMRCVQPFGWYCITRLLLNSYIIAFELKVSQLSSVMAILLSYIVAKLALLFHGLMLAVMCYHSNGSISKRSQDKGPSGRESKLIITTGATIGFRLKSSRILLVYNTVTFSWTSWLLLS